MRFVIVLIFIVACKTVVAPPVEPVVIAPAPVVVEPVLVKPFFTGKSSLAFIHEAAKVADCVVRNESFLKEVGSFKKYSYTTKTPKEVEEAFRNFKPVVVSTYYYWRSKVIATTYAKDRTTVYLNTKSNPRSISAMLNTVIHEGLHLQGFGHGDNSSIGKQDSVPYRVGDIAEKYVTVCSK